jgi:hypothetical protein
MAKKRKKIKMVVAFIKADLNGSKHKVRFNAVNTLFCAVS